MADSEHFESRPHLGAKATRFALDVKRSTAGLGLYAGQSIPKGVTVIEYVGNWITEAQCKTSRSCYLFDDDTGGAIDGSPRWNRARYINHSCKPNCEPVVRKHRVYIRSTRAIRAGEELTYNYGPEYFDHHIGDRCRCIKCAPEQHSALKQRRRA